MRRHEISKSVPNVEARAIPRCTNLQLLDLSENEAVLLSEAVQKNQSLENSL